MDHEQVIQERRLGAHDLLLIRHWLQTKPEWNRTRLSRELCQHGGWRNKAGQLKDMACRTLLLKLERRGQIRLPSRQHPSPNARRNRQLLAVPCDRSPIEAALGDLQPLRIELIETFVDRQRFRGTCYRATGWIHLGTTAGRSRNDRDQTLSVPVKDIYLRALRRQFRRRLCA